jgi:16S rRNA (adenine1518-N6/adenine1519-N6)-dimethyltransferase
MKDIQAKKSLGQNFLRSPEIINDIVMAGKVSKNDVVLEIGPGEGIMTEKLLQTGAKVFVVEKDDRLIEPLKQKFEKEIAGKKLEIIHGDILETNLSMINAPYKIVANIPYYITGQIIRKFLESEKQPISMTLLVQKEVALRIIARDGKESLLSLSVKIFGDPKFIRIVGKGAFSPQPSVDSSVITIENISKDKLQGLKTELFFKVIHLGFAHKRKQLLPNLSEGFDKDNLLNIFKELDLDPKVRAEDVKLQGWIDLCNKLSKK